MSSIGFQGFRVLTVGDLGLESWGLGLQGQSFGFSVWDPAALKPENEDHVVLTG